MDPRITNCIQISFATTIAGDTTVVPTTKDPLITTSQKTTAVDPTHRKTTALEATQKKTTAEEPRPTDAGHYIMCCYICKCRFHILLAKNKHARSTVNKFPSQVD